MPGPAVTVEIRGDSSSLDTALTGSEGKFFRFGQALGGLLSRLGGVTGVISLAGEAFGKLVELGGPEASAAMDALKSKLGDALAPALEKLAPHIVKLIEGLTKLMIAILPVLVPLLEGLATVLGFVLDAVVFVFDAIGNVIDGLGKLIGAMQPVITLALMPFQNILLGAQSALDAVWGAIETVISWIGTLLIKVGTLITEGLNVLWEKLDAVRGIFDLVSDAVQAVLGWFQSIIDKIPNVLAPIQDFIDLVATALGDLQELLQQSGTLEDTSGWSTEIPGRQSVGMRGTRGGFGAVTVNTGADPGAVVRAIRRYSASNGGARGFARHAQGIRGH